MNNHATNAQIISTAEKHIASFHECLDSVAAEHRYIGFVEAPPFEKVREFILSNFINGDSLQFVAVSENTVIGWCDIVLGPLPGFTHAGHLGMGVKQGFRGMGIGKKLLTAALNKALEKKLERVELEVFASNKIAIKLYEKAGFVVEGVKEKARKLDGVYEDIICMALWLE
jgi:ribosomal protein S18 acetylase RimI-like enzyme